MHGILRGTRRRLWLAGAAAATAAITAAICAGAASNSSAATNTRGMQGPTFTWDVAHDVSPTLRDLADLHYDCACLIAARPAYVAAAPSAASMRIN